MVFVNRHVTMYGAYWPAQFTEKASNVHAHKLKIV